MLDGNAYYRIDEDGVFVRFYPRIEARRKAVAEARAAARRDRTGATFDLAAKLFFLGAALEPEGFFEEALQVLEDSAALMRALLPTAPWPAALNLARALHWIALIRASRGQSAEGLRTCDEAIRLVEAHVPATDPRRDLEVAEAENDRGGFLTALGRHPEALAAARRAVGLARAVRAAGHPGVDGTLRCALSNLGTRLERANLLHEALAAAREAHELLQPEDGSDPLAQASSANNLGRRLCALGRHGDAMEPTRQAVELSRIHLPYTPQHFRPMLGLTLCNLANDLALVGCLPEAMANMEESVALHRELMIETPAAFAARTAGALGDYAWLLQRAGRPGDAMPVLQEACLALEPVFRRHPDLQARPLERLLRRYVRACRELGRSPLAWLAGELLGEAEARLAGPPA